MSDAVFFIEMVLIFGGVLAFAVWELIKVRRELARDRERKD